MWLLDGEMIQSEKYSVEPGLAGSRTTSARARILGEGAVGNS